MPKSKNDESNDETQRKAELAGRLLGQAAELTEMAGSILSKPESDEDEDEGGEVSEADIEKLAREVERDDRDSGRGGTLGRGKRR